MRCRTNHHRPDLRRAVRRRSLLGCCVRRWSRARWVRALRRFGRRDWRTAETWREEGPELANPHIPVYDPSVRTLLLVAALFAGCDTPSDRPATWSYVHAAIVAPSCATASCHSKISSVAGRDLSSTYSGYAVFTGRVCRAPSHPGDADLVARREQVMSALYGIGTRSDNGEPELLMPPDQPLASSEIQLIESWYDRGAPCD